MNKRVWCACAALAIGALPCFAAGQSWDGTWKINLAKSNFTGDTYTIEDKGNGKMRFTDGNFSYEFSCDGKPYTIIADRVGTCTGSPQAGYDYVTKAGDKVVAKSRDTFSADGKTLTTHTTNMRPDGTTSADTYVNRRLSGTTGLVGKWQNTKTQLSPDSTMVIETKGDWIKIYDPQYKTTVEGKMDGSNLAMKGPDIPPGVWQTIKPEGANKLRLVMKYNEKVLGEGVQTLSADGKMLVDEEWMPGKMNEKSTAVYERQ